MATGATKIDVFSTCEEVRHFVSELKAKGKSIAVVPTMGALHKGHLSLVLAALESADETIVTIFVNPTQFAPEEDLDQYPKPLENDLRLLEEAGVTKVFAPNDKEMYPQGFSTLVSPPAIGKELEGEFRPSHFGGVCTVVLKLLNLTRADIGFFGQKDFQQAMVIKQMVKDLNVPSEIRVCPIVRETDGLALSSRNVYLSAEEREQALSLSRTLRHIEKQVREGQTDGFELTSEMRQMLIDGGVSSIDYAFIADPDTLKLKDQLSLPVVALIAAHVGTTRLIDNCLIESR